MNTQEGPIQRTQTVSVVPLRHSAKGGGYSE